MKRIQKTKDLGWPVEVKLETGDKQGAYSDLSAMSKLKTESKLNTENLLEKIVDKRNFFEAYKKVVSNKGSSGIDGMRVDELLTYLQENYNLKVNDYQKFRSAITNHSYGWRCQKTFILGL